MIDLAQNTHPWFSLSDFLKQKFGEKVYRVSLDGGFTCPNRDGTLSRGGCLYCNEAGARASYVNPKLSITKQLKEGTEIISRRYKVKKFIAYFQSYTNTYAPLSRLRSLYEEALDFPGIVGIAVGTRPDCVNKNILIYLNSLGEKNLVILEYGVQSLNDTALAAVNRQHDAAQSIKAITNTLKFPNIRVFAHVIFGLPEDNRQNMLDTVTTLCKLGIHGIKFHHLYIEKNTRLARLYEQEKITPLERTEYSDLLIKALSIIPRHIVIDRLFGECSADTLLAPDWTLHKSENIRLLEEKMRRENKRQGCAL